MSLGTQLAGMAGKFTGSVGSGPTLAVIVAGGFLVGGFAGGVLGQQPQTPGPTAQVLHIYPCWKGGNPFANAGRGQHVWAIAKNSDGTWLKLHTGSPTHPEGWVESSLISQVDVAALPVADCAPITTALMITGGPLETDTLIENNSPSPEPTPSPTPTPKPEKTAKPTEKPEETAEPARTARPGATPTPTPKPKPKPTPTPKPTPPPDTTPPKISTPNASPTQIYASKCNPLSSTVTAKVTDSESGVDSVTLYYRASGESNWKSKSMSEGDPDFYSASIKASDEGYGDGTNIAFYVGAVDKEGNDATARSTQVISVQACIT